MDALHRPYLLYCPPADRQPGGKQNNSLKHAGIAQSVEQRIRNAKVGGSIPLSGTTPRICNIPTSCRLQQVSLAILRVQLQAVRAGVGGIRNPWIETGAVGNARVGERRQKCKQVSDLLVC
jgi:hypothetical protein